MIKQIPFVLKLTLEEHKRLIAKRPWNGKWDDNDITDIVNKIRGQLLNNQSNCAYCGLPFKGDKDKQIEHIAPKAKYRQPQFTFTLHNLVLSCGYCNDLIVKGTKPTIALPAHRLYKRCTFIIVHPYFHDPSDFYCWVDEGDKILIQPRNNRIEAKNSIKIFGLASEEMSGWRAAFSMLEKLKAQKPISLENENLVRQTIDYPKL